MRKKLILFIVIICVVSLLAYLGYNVITKVQEKSKIAKRLEVIPEFEFLTLAQKPFTKATLKPNLNTIFIYFNSECDFCQHEAQSISDNLGSFQNMQFLFVSTESAKTIKAFAEKYNLINISNITFLQDNTNTFSNRFDANSIPFILIYNNNQNLIKKHKGQLNAKGILSALQQND